MTQVKKYSLEEKEVTNVTGRKSLMEEHQYLARLIQEDLNNYIFSVIGQRLSIPKTARIRILENNKEIEVEVNEEDNARHDKEISKNRADSISEYNAERKTGKRGVKKA